ncbi:hypothetical protein [Listeria cossartiae]|nr:hypothetical protein [Listeria cossartiae]
MISVGEFLNYHDLGNGELSNLNGGLTWWIPRLPVPGILPYRLF